MAAQSTTTTLGIQELGERLSEYLDRARDGERFLLTDHGEPVAELLPLSSERKTLARLLAEGEVEWQGGKPEGLRGVIIRGEPLSETIIRDRR